LLGFFEGIKLIKCVIFDFDGVIADSHSMFNKLFTRIANEELDLGITNEEFAQFPGMRFELRLSYLAKQKGIDVSQENLDKAIAKGRNEYHESTSSFTTLYEGAKEFLQELRNNNIKVCLGSNGSRRTVLKMLNQFEIFDLFDSIVTYDDVTHGKPAPDMFLKNADNVGVEYGECVVVGDAIEDINAAKAGGMKSIGLLTTNKKETLSVADLIMESIANLNFELVKNL
jgi:HAD superfamily hydrolase (TIGR01509 family)